MNSQFDNQMFAMIAGLSADDEQLVNLGGGDYTRTSGFKVRVKTAGDIHFETFKGTEITHYFEAGYHPVRMRKIFATGTTAAEIVALFT